MVSSYLELLDGEVSKDLSDDARDYLDRALRGAGRMQEMVDAVLGYARVDTRGAEFASVDLATILGRVLEELSEAIDASGAVITHDELPTVVADGAQLHQLLHNLLSNAIKFVGDRDPRIHISAVEDDAEWTVSVRDNGIGMEADSVDRIFVMFQRLHTHEEYPGTGIGLAICKRIVDRHGGRIWVDSQPHRGSTFVFTLPKRPGGEDEATE